MAEIQFLIKCKTEKGSYTLEDLNGDSTVEDLKRSLFENTKMNLEGMKILCGYPPKALDMDATTAKLTDVNIQSGDTIIIETHKLPIAAEGKNTRKAVTSVAELITEDAGIMMRHVVPSNNSCLFTSIYFILSNGKLDTKKSNELRKIIAREVSNNPVKYNAAVLGMRNNEYCRWIMNTDHWGGAIELAILSEHFKLEVVAVDTVSLKVHRFGETSNYMNRVFLIYDGIHYDPLVLELRDALQTIFPTADDIPMQMAIEVAQEAQSSRQYTDVGNFTLCCISCKERVRGDKEARQHAKATGHVNFGEIAV